MKTDNNYHDDDIVDIKEARRRLGANSPSRDAFHKAVGHGTLKKYAGLPGDRSVKFRWGDICDYIKRGGFKKCAALFKSDSGENPSSKADEDAPFAEVPSEGVVVSTDGVLSDQAHADTELFEVDQVDSGQGTSTELDEVKKLLNNLSGLSSEELVDNIKNYAGRAEKFATDAVASGSRALTCALACGFMLNKAKADCGHGNFISWLEKHIIQPVGLSARTCQRYMKLALAWPDPDSLVERKPGLKDAYVAHGILREIEKSSLGTDGRSGGDAGQGDKGKELATSLLYSVSTLRKRLRAFVADGEALSTESVNQLGCLIEELTGLLGEVKQQTTDGDQSY